MLFIDDNLPNHPKVLRAGAKLGPNGPGLVLALYLAGLAYSRRHNTDGYVPDAFVQSCGLFATPKVAEVIARTISGRGVRLWERRRDGYVIHDYFDFNPSKSERNALRAKWREKKAAQRRGTNGSFSGGQNDVSPGDSHRDSRARVRSSTSTKGHPLDREVRVRSTASVQTAAARRDVPTKPDERKPPTYPAADAATQKIAASRQFFSEREKLPAFKVLCAIAKVEYTPALTLGDWADCIKVRLRGQGFRYPPPQTITAAMAAVEHTLQKLA